jgi:hypothetical protein
MNWKKVAVWVVVIVIAIGVGRWAFTKYGGKAAGAVAPTP